MDDVVVLIIACVTLSRSCVSMVMLLNQKQGDEAMATTIRF